MAGIEVELIAVDNRGMRTQKVFLFFFFLNRATNRGKKFEFGRT